MKRKIQALRDVLAELVESTSMQDQTGKLARKALGLANSALLSCSESESEKEKEDDARN